MKAHSQVRNEARRLIGEFISSIIEEKNLNKRQLCRDAGISPTILYKIINGNAYEIDSLLAILQVLNMHIDIKERDIMKNYPDIIEN
jgi:predicted transcriptional regulator